MLETRLGQITKQSKGTLSYFCHLILKIKVDTKARTSKANDYVTRTSTQLDFLLAWRLRDEKHC